MVSPPDFLGHISLVLSAETFFALVFFLKIGNSAKLCFVSYSFVVAFTNTIKTTFDFKFDFYQAVKKHVCT